MSVNAAPCVSVILTMREMSVKLTPIDLLSVKLTPSPLPCEVLEGPEANPSTKFQYRASADWPHRVGFLSKVAYWPVSYLTEYWYRH